MASTVEASSLQQIASQVTVTVGSIMQHLAVGRVQVAIWGDRVQVDVTAPDRSSFEEWRAVLRDSTGRDSVREYEDGALHVDYRAFEAHVHLSLPAAEVAA